MTQRVVTVTVLVVALIALWGYWPSDERRIQQIVQEMATSLRPAEQDTDLARAARLSPLLRGLAGDVVVEGPAPLRGRDEVMAAAMQLGRVEPDLSIVVRNIDVTVDPARTSATALVTVALGGVRSDTGNAWQDLTELQLDLARRDDVWTIARVAPVAGLRR